MRSPVKSIALGVLFLFLVGGSTQAQTVTGTVDTVVPNGDEYVVNSEVLVSATASGTISSGTVRIKLEIEITKPDTSMYTFSDERDKSGSYNMNIGEIFTANQVGQYTVTARLYWRPNTSSPYTLLHTHIHYFFTYVGGGGG